MNEAIIVTGNKYPCEDAGALRQHSTAKMLMDIGYTVTVVGYGKPTEGKILQYEGVNYLSYRPSTNNIIQRFLSRLFFGTKALGLIKSKSESVKIILVVDILPIAFKAIERYAAKQGIMLVHDSVEWYSPEEFKNGVLNAQYILKNITNTLIMNKRWRVIAISKYLENHFSKICLRTTRIPVILDIKSTKYRTEPIARDKTVFAYVGGPGKKDYLHEIIEGFSLLDEEYKNKIELHIIGITEDQLQKECGIEIETIARCKPFMTAHGRLSHDEAVKWVIGSDYTLLLRDETLRYAKAGFPTKVVESLSMGTPVICNISSDLDDYLINQYNSIIIDGHDSTDVRDAIIRAGEIDGEKYKLMRQRARYTAENCFDYSKYTKDIQDLLR